MNKEEIKDYLKRVEELETKLTGKDKDTYQWLIFGYNECAKLLYEEEQKNKQLKDKIDKANDKIDKAIDKLICCGEMLDARFQSDMLDILEESDNNDE